MTRNEFVRFLKKNNIDPTIVSFDDSMSEGYCIRKNHFFWETLYRERGKEYEVIGYPSESDAMIKMAEYLLSVYSKIDKG